MKKTKTEVIVTRPYETDYAGLWRGHCKTRESAILAAMKHVVTDGYTRATITDTTTGTVVARVRVSEDRKHALVETVTQIRRQPYSTAPILRRVA